MLRHSGHPCRCLFHARAESQFIETERLGSGLAQTNSGDFMTATDINHAMGRLYVFPTVQSTTRHDLLRIPYSHFIMECIRGREAA
jgi:hypothetical protein